jgi:DNA-binding helix-hairpin-helix protein with protein kinase domain
MAIGLAIAIIFVAPKAWFLGMLVGIIGWTMAGSTGSPERNAERARRKAAKETVQLSYDRLVEQVKKEAGPEGFHAKKDVLRKLRDEYQFLPQAEKQELDKLHSTAHERQKQKFLDSFFIDSANIPGVGPTRKAALRSFGIETAADIDRNRVRQVRGFGESLTRAVMDWKASCERRFTFNPNSALSDADRNTVRSKFGARRTTIESALSNGVGELQRFRQTAPSRVTSLQPQLNQVAQQLVQAQKDLALL